jgi:hypothetical protein
VNDYQLTGWLPETKTITIQAESMDAAWKQAQQAGMIFFTIDKIGH